MTVASGGGDKVLTDLLWLQIVIFAHILEVRFWQGWSKLGAGDRNSHQLHAFPTPLYIVISKRHGQGTKYFTESAK